MHQSPMRPAQAEEYPDRRISEIGPLASTHAAWSWFHDQISLIQKPHAPVVRFRRRDRLKQITPKGTHTDNHAKIAGFPFRSSCIHPPCTFKREIFCISLPRARSQSTIPHALTHFRLAPSVFAASCGGHAPCNQILETLQQSIRDELFGTAMRIPMLVGKLHRSRRRQ